uniref:Uncharacterized protein n=1 Tax=Arundo donax TaxID=35708 RepID=A0A0A9BQ50_ARUDO
MFFATSPHPHLAHIYHFRIADNTLRKLL